jgi:hypothetical protein
MFGGKCIVLTRQRLPSPRKKNPSLRHRLRLALVNNVSRVHPFAQPHGNRRRSSRKLPAGGELLYTQEGRHLAVTVLVPVQQDVRYFPVVQSECVSSGCGVSRALCAEASFGD